MLVRFSVENFRSIYEEQTLNLVASSASEHLDHVVPLSADKGVLKGSVFYGANGSGKSNLFQAIFFARSFILRGVEPKASIPVVQFRLSDEPAEKNSNFEFVVLINNFIYTYGFEVNHSSVLEEWLIVQKCNEKNESTVFHRTARQDGVISIAFDNVGIDKTFLDYLAKGTRSNKLFLTEAADKNEAQIGDHLKALIGWFRDCLIVISPKSSFRKLIEYVRVDQKFADFVGSFLKAVDTGVESLKAIEEEVDSDSEKLMIPQPVLEVITNDASSGKASSYRIGNDRVLSSRDGKLFVSTLKSFHATKSGRQVEFEIADESDGTRRLIHLLPVLFDISKKGKVVLVDEIDSSLHPILSKAFIEHFYQNCPKGHHQLLVTTHETHLMDLDLFRRDEIWFVEKHQGETKLYSLLDLNVRKDLKISKGYLNGRFGAIPFLGDLKKICPEYNQNPTSDPKEEVLHGS